MAEKFSRFILNNRKVFILLILIYTLFMGYKGLDVEYNYDFSQTVPDTDEEMIYYNSFKKTFGEDGNVFAIGLKDSSIFNIENFRLYNDYVGKVYIVEFFFTTCTTICPIMNTNLVHIQNSFTAFPNFGIASFSINPEYDTSEILSQYAKENGIQNSNWNLMTGNRDDIYKLANDGFNLYTAASSEFIDGFEHSGYFALIDKQGYIRCRKDQFGNPKIYYKGSVDFKDKLDSNGEAEEITVLKEDLLKLLNE